jgi:hypothetical protein
MNTVEYRSDLFPQKKICTITGKSTEDLQRDLGGGGVWHQASALLVHMCNVHPYRWSKVQDPDSSLADGSRHCQWTVHINPLLVIRRVN